MSKYDGEDVMPYLSPQERRVLILKATGHADKQIGYSLMITEETAKSFIRRAKEKYKRIGVWLTTTEMSQRVESGEITWPRAR